MYKKIFKLICVLFAAIEAVSAQDVNPNMGIIPAPVSVRKTAGEFVISKETSLLADSVNNKAVLFLADFLKNKTMLAIQPRQNSAGSIDNSIVLTSAGTEGLRANGYRLTITPQKVTIAGKGAGLFYGIQTLIQLFPAERSGVAKIPCAVVDDYPRYGYRGFMLDVCRHFFTVETVKKYIDLMAAYKLNTFHWHLTDDQGWRIEIKKYPRLTQVGSKRPATVIGNYHDRVPQQYDDTPVSGFYTQDEIRDVIRYAADRYITVVPEIEMPGHALAALTAYPELSCDPTQTYEVMGTWGVFKNVFCPTEKTFSFLQDVLTEVIDLFPSKYIHIGGDEVPKDVWKKSAYCQKLIRDLKLKNEHGLQSYFIQRMEKFVNSKGRSIIGWDEILEGGLAPNATVMSWRGEAGGISAAQQNHNVIMTPSSQGLYLDHAQGKLFQEPVGIGGWAPLEKTYAYNPTPAVLTAQQQKYIIGVQANLWCEYIATENKIEYMLLPRLLALSEIAWTPLANKNFKDFSETRLPQHFAWLERNNYNFRVPPAIGAQDTIIIASQFNVALKSPVNGAKIYYTIDGYTPRETDLVYNIPLSYSVPPNQYREFQTMVITPTGKRSRVTKTTIYNRAPLPAVPFAGTTPGVKYQLFSGTFGNTGRIETAPRIDTGVVKTFSPLAFKKNNKTFGVIYTGYINIPADGTYEFGTQSADGSVLLIDDQPVVDNDGRHNLFEQGGAIPLQKGFHKITVRYFNIGATSILKVFMTMPGRPKGELSAATLLN
ncbi:beta-N-acetylhexosaminidase [Mucilaginibacter hurinus]|uniref:beta-N-acetylhexosaminidase n=1 Tax=Mucilaginibacter hurinus TaxID=2201324 RepID=A0A367GRP1_9SPHI|nr:family 20 glycosylhydrolase [Mucilaginibacter hurinus]RCH56109.1 beta-N-acetylhexosaminidase [Mucilaginibacter hurinus]